MQRLNLFRLIVFISVILAASLYELNKDYKKLQAKEIEKMEQQKHSLVHQNE
ncbi:hypothetical protein [Putridiphycobacter roseus]|uniref:hypothetical protein n=1 Tax=Putridiphycobacter roseus TaxID=2219161 RepID=UPI002678C3E2